MGTPADHGQVPEEVARAIGAYAEDPGRLPELLAVLQRSRLLVPVVAVLTAADPAGGAPGAEKGSEKGSEMATVLLRGNDGRTALLAFSGTPGLAAWDPAARPVPVSAADAARAAVAEGAEALVIDVAGPVPIVVDGDDLRGFAEGWTLARVGERTAWVR